MKYLRAGTLVVVGLVLTGTVVSCRDRDVSVVTGAARETPADSEQGAIDHCVPGQTLACAGGCGAPGVGYQVCTADGHSFDPCICPPLRTLGPILDPSEDAPHILSRDSLIGGLRPSPSATGTGLVGATCRQRADCLSGLDCLTAAGSALSLSGPAGGYCTAACSSDAGCQAIDRGSECAPLAGQNACVRSCASRASPSGVSKCLDRTDVMCVSVAALRQADPADGPQRGVCLPACQSDAQCGPGSFCDLGSGLCTSEPPAGDPIGTTCAGPDSCASGLCLTLSASFEGFCSGFCRFGGPGCGFDDSAAVPGAGCVLAQVPGEGVGDRGLCLELCQTASDCVEAGASCIPTLPGGSTKVCVVSTVSPAAPPPPAAPPDVGVLGGPERTGSACSGSADCGAGFECLSSAADAFGLGGGLNGGYCSVSCAPGAACAEPGSVCVTTTANAGAFCLRACTPQTGGDCGDRSDLICIPFSSDATTGFCLPDCSAGADCGARVCDPALGLCVDAPADGSGSGTEPPPAASPTGDACSVSAECGSGFQCLTPDSDPFGFGGGFGGGYCSTPCAGSCEEPGSVCVSTDPNADGFCLRACNPQAGGDCGERSELFCIPFSADPTAGFCLPDCTAGAACGDRVCDPGLGLCVAGPVPECAQDEDCAASRVCVAGSCVDAAPVCTVNADCSRGACDTETQTCVLTPPPCTTDSECTAGTCDVQLGQCVTTPPACTTDSDCGAQLCDSARGVCVEPPAACTTDTDCSGQVCDTNVGVCVPPPSECTTDADCGVRVCDLGRGACVDAACALDVDCADGVCDRSVPACVPAPAIAAGGACSLDGDCVGGLCASARGGAKFCSGVCLFNTSTGCEPYGTDAFCLVPLPAPNDDLGFCIELCDSAADCEQVGYVCANIGTTINGRTGGCLPPVPPATPPASTSATPPAAP